MSEAKVSIKVGDFEFTGEGEQEWVAAQLDKILAKADFLIKLSPPQTSEDKEPGVPKQMGPDAGIAKKTLPGFLTEKNATRNQVKKFLATAVWLEAKGKTSLTTADVSTALRTANQSKIGNPSDVLNQNVAKGHCEKDGNEFFVTEDGKKSL
jgi:hypothetical protein